MFCECANWVRICSREGVFRITIHYIIDLVRNPEFGLKSASERLTLSNPRQGAQRRSLGFRIERGHLTICLGEADCTKCAMSLKVLSYANIARQGAVSLSEAGNQVSAHHLKTPDCSRYRSFSLGLCSVCLSEALFIDKGLLSPVQVEFTYPALFIYLFSTFLPFVITIPFVSFATRCPARL